MTGVQTCALPILMAAMVLETVGTQEYQVRPDEFGTRLRESYGDDVADEIEPFLV